MKQSDRKGPAGRRADLEREAKRLFRKARYFTSGQVSDDGRVVVREQSEAGEEFYRDRWRHDKHVRSTHGVNCTGSCSWEVFVRDGIIVWERQATDYPETPPDVPDVEPRGCPRGATFSWYTYNPSRIKYPYVRASLLDAWQEARRVHQDPVDAWASIARDPDTRARWVGARGHGDFVRAGWDDVLQLVAAAHVFTIKEYGPDRVVGVSPIPAMSLVSHASGTRYMNLTGAATLSFYDWYADLPPASPQVFGEQTDVPESADWWNAGYLIIWGTNIPVTRSPDAHFMVEARYAGQKVVVVSPDYAEHVKFADEWLPIPPGEDGALAMAMGHVIFREFYVDRQVPYFQKYAKTYTDMPFLVLLREHEDEYVAERFLTASDLEPGKTPDTDETGAWKTVVFDSQTERAVVPDGSQGFRWADSGRGRWNLDLADVDPALSLLGRGGEQVTVVLPRFDSGPAGTIRRSVPALRLGGHLVATVFDLLLAQYGVAREGSAREGSAREGSTQGGSPADWPADYDDPSQPYTPAWQETITQIPRQVVVRIAREFARNAEITEGRSMIAMGSGVNHWFHADITYRAMITPLLACGCIGRTGGGWAHYVGQEKIRPLTGWTTLSTALDWTRPPRQASGTAWYYVATDQWRYEVFGADALAWPLARGLLRDKAPIDALAQANRLGWQVLYPTFDRNPLALGEEAKKAELEGRFLNDHIVDQLKQGRLRFSIEDPDDPVNWPRMMMLWRYNLFGSSGKGHEYFVRHLVGSEVSTALAKETPPEQRPRDVAWREPAPLGKLDLLVASDFRMTSTTAFSDVILPAATWYEKSDLSCTDMHSFVHSFNAAIDPPWEARSDWDTFRDLAQEFSLLARKHLGVAHDVVATALAKDTPAEASQPHGRVKDWSRGETEAVPGRTMPLLSLVERDFGAVYDQYIALGPLLDAVGAGAKGVTWSPAPEIEWLREANTMIPRGPAEGRPSLYRAEHAAEAVLALSGATNGRAARAGFESLAGRVGRSLARLTEGEADRRIRWSDVQARPQKALVSPEWSGNESGDRLYNAFTINVEELVPWRTLTGRMQFLVDHEWFAEIGELLPIYRPPLNMPEEYPEAMRPPGPAVALRYLTPHSKWSIHSTYQDNPLMLTLFRGGPVLWMSPADAERVAVNDNDWIEMWNRNGVLDCRAVVSPRMPQGLCYMYHALDRHVQVPRTEMLGKPGGTDNTLTRILVKPTHMVGGYAQLSYALNYYGCTGSQRDEVVLVRRRTEQSVRF